MDVPVDLEAPPEPQDRARRLEQIALRDPVAPPYRPRAERFDARDGVEFDGIVAVDDPAAGAIDERVPEVERVDAHPAVVDPELERDPARGVRPQDHVRTRHDLHARKRALFRELHAGGLHPRVQLLEERRQVPLRERKAAPRARGVDPLPLPAVVETDRAVPEERDPAVEDDERFVDFDLFLSALEERRHLQRARLAGLHVEDEVVLLAVVPRDRGGREIGLPPGLRHVRAPRLREPRDDLGGDGERHVEPRLDARVTLRRHEAPVDPVEESQQSRILARGVARERTHQVRRVNLQMLRRAPRRPHVHDERAATARELGLEVVPEHVEAARIPLGILALRDRVEDAPPLGGASK